MGFEYIQLARHFVEEVLQTYEDWNGKDGVPQKLQELMMVLQIELSDLTNEPRSFGQSDNAHV